ncbi:MAG TPA: NAD(P)/FAD-dependent oxidoreductase [Oscillospiraceae bacterium]|nr:NAD(P)/FAD-dependent oxidoreductase [Oscillospiraceae bacterium]HPF55453.1 NAD(P)/FAD-dependent oxidoreductase [Clostridiales bacterium]HPK36233.1 NAD(P)/FAD-dependent oxidoreductase [Oscillospiraceae bacterium]HPR75499.1 NAD(P)/FAD-dependent oxidoreductase [Oscillospiraceae bacterium]
MKQVIVIGAGPAGLTAADELLRRGGYEVTVLEESDEIGGISKTVRYNGNRMDIGGHRFFSKSDEIMKRWEQLMPLQGALAIDDKLLDRERPVYPGGPDPEKEDRVMLVRHRVSRIYYLKKFFDYPISMKASTIKGMGFGRTMKAGFSYLKSAMIKKPETSLENFYINRFGKVLYGMFFEGYTEKLWGRHPSDISADWGAQRVKGLSIRTLLKDMFSKAFGKKNNQNAETSLIEEFWYPKFGPGQLWEGLADDIVKRGAVLKKNCGVKRLIVENSKVTGVVCATPDGEKTESADIVISSMPLRDLVLGIEGEKPSDEMIRIADGLPYRDFVTVGLLVKRMNLKNETDIKTLGNIVPDCWIYVQETEVKLGRIQIFNNWSPYMVKDPEHTVWIGLEYFCAEGDDFWNMPNDERVKFAAKELEKMGIIGAEDVLDSHCERVKKAYPAYFDTYAEIDKLIDYLNSIENLYCIGRNGQHRYNNMDHSMMTAMVAVDAIENGGEKTAVWSVNTEKEYHEKKESEEGK